MFIPKTTSELAVELKERLKRGLEHSRWFTDRLLSEITLPEDWVRRPIPSANHALWIAGHLGLATNSFIGFVDPTQKIAREDLCAAVRERNATGGRP